MAEELMTVKISIRNVPKGAYETSSDALKELARILGTEARIPEEIVLDYNNIPLGVFLQIFTPAMACVFTRQVMATIKKEEDNNKNTDHEKDT